MKGRNRGRNPLVRGSMWGCYEMLGVEIRSASVQPFTQRFYDPLYPKPGARNGKMTDCVADPGGLM